MLQMSPRLQLGPASPGDTASLKVFSHAMAAGMVPLLGANYAVAVVGTWMLINRQSSVSMLQMRW